MQWVVWKIEHQGINRYQTTQENQDSHFPSLAHLLPSLRLSFG